MTDETPSPPPQDPPMDIHKPHAAKTWKEFFIELGTVVLGILIAISLEQAVEYVHWDHEVTAARHALTAEMASDNTGFFAFRVAIAPCLERQMTETQAILDTLQAGAKAQPLVGFRAGYHALISDAEWQSERSSQVLTHFPREELAAMSSYYAQIPNFEGWLDAERTAWQDLSILKDLPGPISPPELNRMRVDLFAARRMEYLIERNSRRELVLTRQAGQSVAPPPPQRVRKYCSRISMEEWQRWQNATNSGFPQMPSPRP